MCVGNGRGPLSFFCPRLNQPGLGPPLGPSASLVPPKAASIQRGKGVNHGFLYLLYFKVLTIDGTFFFGAVFGPLKRGRRVHTLATFAWASSQNAALEIQGGRLWRRYLCGPRFLGPGDAAATSLACGPPPWPPLPPKDRGASLAPPKSRLEPCCPPGLPKALGSPLGPPKSRLEPFCPPGLPKDRGASPGGPTPTGINVPRKKRRWS
jgi:hypothetical protein